MALAMLEGIQNILGCQKVTMYPIDYYVGLQTTTNVPKDRKECLQLISFEDESENVPTTLQAIVKNKSLLCEDLIFSSVRTFHENILIDSDGKRMGIIIKQCKGKQPGPSFIVQAEFHIDPANQTKSPRRDKTKDLISAPNKFTYTQVMSIQLFCMNV